MDDKVFWGLVIFLIILIFFMASTNNNNTNSPRPFAPRPRVPKSSPTRRHHDGGQSDDSQSTVSRDAGQESQTESEEEDPPYIIKVGKESIFNEAKYNEKYVDIRVVVPYREKKEISDRSTKFYVSYDPADSKPEKMKYWWYDIEYYQQHKVPGPFQEFCVASPCKKFAANDPFALFVCDLTSLFNRDHVAFKKDDVLPPDMPDSVKELMNLDKYPQQTMYMSWHGGQDMHEESRPSYVEPREWNAGKIYRWFKPTTHNGTVKIKLWAKSGREDVRIQFHDLDAI